MSVEDEIQKIMDFASVGLTSLDVLFFPIQQIADSTETDIGVVGTASKILTGAGVVSVMGSMGMLYHKYVDIPPIIKWLLVPLILLHVGALLVLFGLLGFGKTKLIKGVEFGIKYVMPFLYSFVGVLIIPFMVYRKEVTMNYIGKVIYYLPAGLGVPPINKSPYYAIVILVRAGGLISSLAGQIIELASGDSTETKEISSGDNQTISLT
ncbi:hypothetical protein [Algoriphagus zhangzhouensis]|uniref:Uncharacterized protein n=1 Tax=Algoriphagus zhangzhouensis TaxID=1073327 RepID=A0A1M7ZI76_9BACT|nr:hypothetical protein [Algoriphagus zhangzhouensis]TDY44304.1 hypothetical protein A8938_3517 [Algoriphagus zhangzhouensis]SHO64529.1 hypothetical protein SAMN04488108_3512 [Algoriphagus zhangzhouensis]